MNNEKLLNQAILLLQDVDADELETVQINHTKYDDGSVGFTVELTYPPEKVSDNRIVIDGKELGEIIEPYITDYQNKKQRNKAI